MSLRRSASLRERERGPGLASKLIVRRQSPVYLYDRFPTHQRRTRTHRRVARALSSGATVRRTTADYAAQCGQPARRAPWRRRREARRVREQAARRRGAPLKRPISRHFRLDELQIRLLRLSSLLGPAGFGRGRRAN